MVALAVAGRMYWLREQRLAAAAEQQRKLSEPPPPYDYGPAEEKVKRLRARLEREPCDRNKVLDLCDTIIREGDNRGTLEQADRFLAKCGDFPRLRWLTYAAHKQLSEWELAAVEASKLITSDPYDADFRAWRAQVYEQKPDLERAIEDYRQALVLRPQLADVAVSLANIYERQAKPCDAVAPLAQLVFFHPDAENIEAVRAHIDQLEGKPECSPNLGQGSARLKPTPGEGVLIASVRINDKLSGKFIVDTGATLVVLTRAFADKLELPLAGAPSVLARTANGMSECSLVVLDQVAVQGVYATRTLAAVSEKLDGIDGLLGMSFLSRFDLHQTHAGLEIVARKRQLAGKK